MRYSTPGKILVVDDESQNVEVLRRLMTRLGYDVLTATDGESALHAVLRDPPDLVLLDVNMSGIDGFEVCRRLKATHRDGGQAVQRTAIAGRCASNRSSPSRAPERNRVS